MTTAISKLKLPRGIIRIAAILLGALVTVLIILPRAEGFVEEARSSKAASKGRVLMRGAQIAATEQLAAGGSFDDAAKYLTSAGGLEQSIKTADFPVTAVEITRASLNEKGLLTEFACVVEFENRRYSIDFDLADRSGSVLFLEEVPEKETSK